MALLNYLIMLNQIYVRPGNYSLIIRITYPMIASEPLHVFIMFFYHINLRLMHETENNHCFH